MNMKRALILSGIVLLAICCAVIPAQAFTAKSLDVVVKEDTGAIITFDYELSWFENIAVFLRIADPGVELKKALEGNFNKPVDVIAANGGRSQFVVQGFASKNEQGATTTVRTPALSFKEAETVLKQYWFAPLINPDFSPDVTKVTFSDGYEEFFYNQDQIPAITHVLNPESP
jgi:hypothetical protein